MDKILATVPNTTAAMVISEVDWRFLQESIDKVLAPTENIVHVTNNFTNNTKAIDRPNPI